MKDQKLPFNEAVNSTSQLNKGNEIGCFPELRIKQWKIYLPSPSTKNI